jgi:hypothetical protein
MLWLINLLLAVSNIPGFYISLHALEKGLIVDSIVILLLTTASMLFHLSEQKHKLPGIPPFSQVTHGLLWLDRIFATMGACYFIKTVLYNNKLFYRGLIGITGLILSEHIDAPQFFILHTLWHLIVYWILSDIVSYT